MKNLRNKKKTNKELVEFTPNTIAQTEYSDICAKKDVEFLKSTKVDANSMEIIKEKLKLTSSYRKRLINDISVDLLEYFPYFFTCPDLVSMAHELNCYIFSHRYIKCRWILSNWKHQKWAIVNVSAMKYHPLRSAVPAFNIFVFTFR